MVPISLPHTKLALPAYYIIAPAEASSNLARYDGVRYGNRSKCDPRTRKYTLNEMYQTTRSEAFGVEVQRRIMAGNFVLSAGAYEDFYQNAIKVRGMVEEDFQAVL